MQYRNDKHGNPLSVLGYGCMRFTQGITGIDLAKTEKEILYAIEHGVNYFDTAYIYPGSEAALGEILARNNMRDKVNIATKLPHYLVKDKKSLDKYFNEELKRLHSDHVDYYLMHMLPDTITWNRLLDLGIGEWIKEKKESGQIRNIGFSYHGNSDLFCELIDAYDWDFAQIQYNYLDEHSQAGVKGLKHANAKGIPIIIMEPLRGGRLATKLPKTALSLMNSYPKKKTPAQWSFDWLWNQPEVTCVLSGMNSLEMVEENIRSAEASYPGKLDEDDMKMLEEVVKQINATMKVPCTGCRYCMPCPNGVDIPGVFAAYNRSASDGYMRGFFDYLMCTGLRKETTGASHCIECGKCERHCPQSIHIREELKNVQKTFETPLYKIAIKAIRIFMKY
ncbi:MAG: aldo/keto reductase [Erysipelotrichaceae bacterium]|nr:aldo/keto reductase [Erysipelotrichaceae bacterium]